MTLPSFLIIGGMKCGSTTLYRDLANSPSIFFPLDKEPENLTSDHVFTPSGKLAYEQLFSKAEPGQLCAEASTAYTKLPTHESVPDRALQLLGPELKVIYIIRDPIDRMESHMHHAVSGGEWEPMSFEQSVQAHPELLAYSQYGMQIQPWIRALGSENIRILRFEDYTDNRRLRCVELWDWLGAESRPELIQESSVFNDSKNKPILKGPFRWVPHNPIYRQYIRPVLSNHLKDRVRGLVLPKARITRQQIDRTSLSQCITQSLFEDNEIFKAIPQSCMLGPTQLSTTETDKE